MNQYTLAQLRTVADQLSFLAGIFQLKPFHLRAKQIRLADKTLASAEALFSSILALESKQWKEAASGLAVLRKKLLLLEENKKLMNDLDEKILQLKTTTEPWTTLEENERKRILQAATRAQKFVDSQDEKSEAHILHRYHRFSALSELIPYADNANHLCEAIYYYENRKKYDDNILTLNQKIEKLKKRIKTVQNGFWLAIILCCFLVTIPICLPFSASLLKRKGQIKKEIESSEEMLKRENKRLLLAQEGAAVASKIKKVLGDITLEEVRLTLAEVRDLRTEFQGPDQNPSSTAALLNFIDLNRMKLEKLFGEIPKEPLSAFRWLSENVIKFQEIEILIVQLEEKKTRMVLRQNQLAKGYSQEKLTNSMQKLQNVVSTTMDVPFELENKMFFADLCTQIPDVLIKMREALYFLSKGQSPDLNHWNTLKLKIQGFSNMMSLCILDAEIVNQFGCEEFDGVVRSDKNESIDFTGSKMEFDSHVAFVDAGDTFTKSY